MIGFTPYIILLPIIIVLVVLILRMRKRIKELEKKLSAFAGLPPSSDFGEASRRDEASRGFEEYNQKMREQRVESKNKILELLKEKNEINNNDVEKALGIGDSTATKYLQELEDEGKIVQKFETGRGVVYTLK